MNRNLISILYTLLFLSITYQISSQSIFTKIFNDIDGEDVNDNSGYSVSISSSGAIVAIGAPFNSGSFYKAGHVRVYEINNGEWVQIGNDINGVAANDQAGYSVSLSSDGSILAVGSPYNDGNGSNSGLVRVYKFNKGSWVKIGEDIKGQSTGDNAGCAVSLNSEGNILAIGSYMNADIGVQAGHVRIFEFDNGSWIQMGSNINADSDYDRFGISLELNEEGNKLAIGSYNFDGLGNSGYVKLYEYTSNDWQQIGNKIICENTDDMSGVVSFNSDGNIVAIGAIYNDGHGSNSGHVRVYAYNGTSWVQRGTDINGEAMNDRSGCSVSLSSDGNRLAIGAYFNNGSGNASGHVRVYDYNGSTWIKIADDIDGEYSLDYSGWSVSMNPSGTIIAIGATGNDGGGNMSGHVRVYGLCGSVNSFSKVSCNSYISPGGNTAWSSPGNYSDSIILDSNCTISFNIDLDIINSTSSNIDSSVCHNQYYISPSGKDTLYEEGLYIDTIMNSAGCDSVITINLSHYDIPDVNLGEDILITENQIVIIGAGYNLNSYLWNTGDTTASIVIIGDSIGVGEHQYWIIAENEYNCYNSDTIRIIVSDNIGINDISNKIERYIYPNPSNGKIYFNIPNTDINVYDSYGNEIIKQKVGNQNSVDLSNQPKGIYLIKINTEGETIIEKIIIE